MRSLLSLLLPTAFVLGATPPAQVELIGRIPTSGLFTWPSTGLRFAFQGTQANFTFSTSGANALTISVDGSSVGGKTIFPNSVGSAVLSTGVVRNARHVVEVSRVSETDHGTITFGSITTSGGALTTLTSSEARSTRKIEFIGDSITAGYGIEAPNPCSDSVQTENSGRTYAALLSSSLSADASLIAWSGRGVSRNYPGSEGVPIMPTLWTQTSALDTSPTYTFPSNSTPNAVVINLGTNDFAYLSGSTQLRPPITQSAYTNAIVSFVRQIRTKYRTAKIFLVSSPMLSDGFPAGQNQHSTQLAGLQGAKTQLGDSGVFVVDLPAQGSDVGCDFHPSPATHQQMANILLPVMKQALGW